MVRVISLNVDKIRSNFQLKESEWAKKNYPFYSQVETHISALEELLDYFEMKLEMSSKGKHKAKVAEFNFVEFVNECRKEFVPKAKEYVDNMNQQAYTNGIFKTLIALELELLNICKVNNQDVDGNSLSTLCIVWK